MKKNYFLGALLLGIFILTSCVDNEESLSVEELRKSKSELLKSQAALNAADAEAIKILAAADVALKNAQAEAEKANTLKIAAETEIIKLQAELQGTENEQAKVKLQNELERQKVIKAESEAKLKRIANQLLLDEQQLQADLAQTEARLLQAQKDLADLKNDLSEAEKAKLQELSTKYINKVFTLNIAKQTLSGLKVQLIQAENNLVNLEESKAKNIEQNNRDIAFYQAQIDVYKQYAGYNGDLKELEDAVNAKENELLIASDKSQSLFNAIDQKRREVKSQSNLQPIWNTDYFKAASTWPGKNYVTYPNAYGRGFDYLNIYGNNVVDDRIFYSYDYVELHSDKDIYIQSYYQKIILPIADLLKFEIAVSDVVSFEKVVQKEVEEKTEVYIRKKDEVETKGEEWRDAEGTDEEGVKRAAYESAINEENIAKNNLADAEKRLKEAQDEVTKYKNAYAILNDPGKQDELKSAIDTRNALFTNVGKAYLAYSEASIDRAVLNGEYQALWNIYIDANNINEWITNNEKLIKDLEADNAYILDITSQKEFIERLKSTIDAQEKDVAVKQKAADDAKKLLDKALAEE